MKKKVKKNVFLGRASQLLIFNFINWSLLYDIHIFMNYILEQRRLHLHTFYILISKLVEMLSCILNLETDIILFKLFCFKKSTRICNKALL